MFNFAFVNVTYVIVDARREGVHLTGDMSSLNEVVINGVGRVGVPPINLNVIKFTVFLF